MALELSDILLDPPLPHKGGTLVWGLSEDVLRHLDTAIPTGAKTLETGSGISTILFALRSAEHTCITPSAQEITLLKEYAQKKGISLDNVTFEIDFSQNVLPNLQREDLDFVLIDGGHGYPIPEIDWFFTAPMLKTGGVVIVDDIQLWTGMELKRFLAKETSWEQVKDFERSAAFKKIGDDYAREWCDQPYIVKKSRILRIQFMLKNALGLLFSGQFAEFSKRAGKLISKK